MTPVKQYVEGRKGRQEKPELMMNGYLWTNFETLLKNPNFLVKALIIFFPYLETSPSNVHSLVQDFDKCLKRYGHP